MLIRMVARASWHILMRWHVSKNQITRLHLWGLNELSCSGCSMSSGRKTMTHLSLLSSFVPHPKQSAHLNMAPSFPAARVMQMTWIWSFPDRNEHAACLILPHWRAAQLLSFLSSCCSHPCFLLSFKSSPNPHGQNLSAWFFSLSVRSISVSQAALKVFVRTV